MKRNLVELLLAFVFTASGLAVLLLVIPLLGLAGFAMIAIRMIEWTNERRGCL